MQRWPVAALLLGFSAALASAQFYSSLDQAQRQRLAEDYYLAGSQYLAEGLEKGRDFQELARIMYPQLDPRTIRDVAQPSAAELLARGDVAMVGPAEAGTAAGSIRGRLLRFISAVLTEDADALYDSLDGSLYLTDYRGGTEIGRAAAREQMAALFRTVNLAGVAPSRLYRLETLTVSRATPELVARGFADTWTADIDAAMDLSGSLPVWSMHQRFYFRQNGGSWLIFAVGTSLPPSGWKPAPIGAATAETAVTDTARERATVESSFLSCVARFLQKDRDGAVRYFAPRVRIERLGATVARADLGTAFQSYFGTMDFGGLKTEELVEPQSVFVVETDRFPELATGRRYLLTVETRLDLAARIPFWTKFQEYYFAQIDGAWKIYAIF